MNETRVNTTPYTIDPAVCVCCGRCVNTCPVKAIIMTDFCASINGQCIDCGACESVCPAEAIHRNARFRAI